MTHTKRKTQHQHITAIIYDKKGRILSIGKNSYIKTHTLMYKISKQLNPSETPKRIYIHAEIDAIVKCENLDKAYKILVVRINAAGEKALAKPCPICMSAIVKSGIKIIEYSDNDTEIKTI